MTRKARPAGLVVESLGDEVLVYDTERNEAHCLTRDAAARFAAASDDVSRRQVIRRLAAAGAAAAGAPLIKTVVAPDPAAAQSAPGCPQVPFCAEIPPDCPNVVQTFFPFGDQSCPGCKICAPAPP
jgi:hypothetical protein